MAVLKYRNPNYVEGSDELKWIPLHISGGGGDNNIDLSAYATKVEVSKKQDVLVSGTNIKTINGESVLGTGDLVIESKDIDLSNYYTKDETYTQEEVNELIDGVSSGNIDLTNYYTKSEVDSKIPTDYITEIPSEYITETELTNKGYATTSAIPTKISALTNDVGYITSIPATYVTETELTTALQNYARTSSIPTSTSDLTNDSGFITSIPSEYVTEQELSNKGYITEDNLESLTSPIVSSYDEFDSFYVSVNSDASITIQLYGLSSTYPFNNYSDIYTALQTAGKIVQVSSEFNTINVSIQTVRYFSYQSFGVINGTITDSNGQLYNVSGGYVASVPSTSSSPIFITIAATQYSPVEMMKVTYQQLKGFVDSGKLVPGRKYAITDYSCIYVQPVTNIEMEISANDIEYIVCTASSSSTLYEDVQVKRANGYVPIVECKYDINPESCSWTAGMTSKSPKGVIWYMKDANGNSCTYDFKHIKFRRWEITDITANMEKDTGSGGTAGPFKVGMGSSTYNWSDNRHRIGAGESSETTMIPAIFDGTWAACTADLSINPGLESTISSFHSDYAVQCHKPYQNTTYSDDCYLSWTTDMRSSDGISPASNKGTCTVYGMSNVTVTTSFKDVYTFYNGSDASESTIYGSTEPLVENVQLHSDNYSKNQSLPNTCFLFSKGCINSASTFIKNVKITDPNSNTFLLRTYATYGSSKIENLVCDTTFKSNLCICQYWQHIHFKAVAQFNYFCCDLDTAVFGGLINKNVYFGYLRGITIGNSQLNLWYNSFRKVKFSSASSWANPQDGFYTQYFTADNFLDSNILGPFQYSKTDPHVNTNTFRCIYNKGVEIGSANQCNSYGPLLWGTKIGYGCGQGICFNSLVRTEIPASAFISVLTKNNTGQEMLDSSLSYIPDMVAVDVKSVSANPTYISSMTSSMLSRLSDPDSTTRKILYADSSSTWVCKLYQ